VATAESSVMKAIVAQVPPVLKAAGFRKQRHAFDRTVEPGLVHVVHFQMGPYDPPGTVEIPGLRYNLYGLFAVNLGVFIEEAWRLDFGRFGPDGPPARKDWVNEYDCQLRRRLDNLAEESPIEWWPLGDPGVGPALVELLQSDAFVWFDRFGSRAAILSALEAAPFDSNEVSGLEPDQLLAMRMRLGAGERTRAQDQFNDWVTYCRAKVPAEPWTQGHLEYLAGFAANVGLTMPGPG
jgi:Domain of unknown function (DUF4304)